MSVFGVSADDVRSHARFRKKLNLPYPLLADTDHSVCEAYGVWQQKSMMGKKYMGIARTTYLIDPDGKVARVFEDVKSQGHGDQVAEALEELKRKRD